MVSINDNDDNDDILELVRKGSELSDYLFSTYTTLLALMSEKEQSEFFKLPCAPLTNHQLSTLLGYIQVLEKGVLAIETQGLD